MCFLSGGSLLALLVFFPSCERIPHRMVVHKLGSLIFFYWQINLFSQFGAVMSLKEIPVKERFFEGGWLKNP